MAKLGAIGLGLALVGVGALFIRFGGRLTAELNRLYARIPGHFQYPPRYHRLVGSVVIDFGVLVGCVGGVLAH